MPSLSSIHQKYGGASSEEDERSIGSDGQVGLKRTQMVPAGFRQEPEQSQAPVVETPEQQLERKFSPISEDIISQKKQDHINKTMHEVAENLYDSDGFATAVGANITSARINSKLNSYIMDAADSGDRESAAEIIKWRDGWNQTKQELIEAGDHNYIESKLFQAAESAPYMVKVGLASSTSAVLSGQVAKRVVTPIIGNTARTALADASTKLVGSAGSKSILKKVLAKALPKAAARMAASDLVLTGAQAGAAATGVGAVPAVAAEVLQWAVIGGLMVWDAVSLMRTLSKDEETGLVEAKSIPFMLSPKGLATWSVAKEMAGAHYADQVNAGIDPEYINEDASRALGLLQGGIESIFNPFQFVGPAAGAVNKAVSKLFTSAVAHQGSNTLRLLKIPARVAMFGVTRVVPEMGEEGLQAVAGDYYLSKEARDYITKHPEVATTAAAYANLSTLSESSAKDLARSFVDESVAAGPVSLIFALAGLPFAAVGNSRHDPEKSVALETEADAEAEMAGLASEQLNEVITEVADRTDGGIETWSYKDVVRVRAAAVELHDRAIADGNAVLEDLANQYIEDVDRAELRGDILSFFDQASRTQDEAQSYLTPGIRTKDEVLGLMQVIADRRKEAGRRTYSAERYLELVYGENFEYKADPMTEGDKKSQRKAEDKAVAELETALDEGKFSFERESTVREVFAERIEGIEDMGVEELLSEIKQLRKKEDLIAKVHETLRTEAEVAGGRIADIKTARKRVLEFFGKEDSSGEIEKIDLATFTKKYYAQIKAELGRKQAKLVTKEEAFEIYKIARAGQFELIEDVTAPATPVVQNDPVITVDPKRKAADEKLIAINTALRSERDVYAGTDKERYKRASAAKALLAEIASKEFSTEEISAKYDAHIEKFGVAEESAPAVPDAPDAPDAKPLKGPARRKQILDKPVSELSVADIAELRKTKVGVKELRAKYEISDDVVAGSDDDVLGAIKSVAEEKSKQLRGGALIKSVEESGREAITEADVVELMSTADGRELMAEVYGQEIVPPSASAEEVVESMREEELILAEPDESAESDAPKADDPVGTVEPNKKKEGHRIEPIADQLIRSLGFADSGSKNADADKAQLSGIEAVGVNVASIMMKVGTLMKRAANARITSEDIDNNIGKVLGVDGVFADNSLDRTVVTSIPAEFLDESGGLKDTVSVRLVYVNKGRWVYDNAYIADDHKTTSDMMAIQVVDSDSAGPAYSFALIAPKGMDTYGSPARATKESYYSATALGYQAFSEYTPLDLSSMNEEIDGLMRKSGLSVTSKKSVPIASAGTGRAPGDIGVGKKNNPYKDPDVAQKKLDAGDYKPTDEENALRDKLRLAEEAEVAKRGELESAKLLSKRKDAEGFSESLKEMKKLERELATLTKARNTAKAALSKVESARPVSTKPSNLTHYVQERFDKDGKSIGFVLRKSVSTDEDVVSGEATKLRHKGSDGEIREQSIKSFITSIWHSAKNANLRKLYEKEIGEDTESVQGINDANANSILAILIRQAVLKESRTGSTQKLISIIDGSGSYSIGERRKYLAGEIKKYAGNVVGEIRGEHGIKVSLELLRKLDPSSREEIATNVEALLRTGNAFVFGKEAMKGLSRKERAELKKHDSTGARESLVYILDSLLSSYTMLKQERADFFGTDITKRMDTPLYEALLRVLDTVSSMSDSAAGSRLDDLYRQEKPAKREKLKGLASFIDLVKRSPSYESPSNFRPMQIKYGADLDKGQYPFKADNKTLDLLLARFSHESPDHVETAAQMYAVDEALPRKMASLENAKSRDFSGISDPKKLEKAKENNTSLIERLEKDIQLLGSLKKMLADNAKATDVSSELIFKMGAEIDAYKHEARVYAIERRLTPSIIGMVVTEDSPFRVTGASSFIGEISEEQSVGEETVASIRAREFTQALSELRGVAEGKAVNLRSAEAALKRVKKEKKAYDLLSGKIVAEDMRLAEAVDADRQQIIERAEKVLEVARAHAANQPPKVVSKAGHRAYATEAHAIDSAKIERERMAKELLARSDTWKGIISRLDGDYSIANIRKHIGGIKRSITSVEKRGAAVASGNTKLAATQALRDLRRERRMLEILETAYTPKKRIVGRFLGTHPWILETINGSGVIARQEAIEAAMLTKEEFTAGVRAEANHFGMGISEDATGITLVADNGKRLRIEYHAEGLGKGEENTAGITQGDLIQIASMGANQTTIKHELAEWSFHALLDGSEQAVIIEAYGGAHEWAELMESYDPVTAGRRVNIVVNKVRNFFRGILRMPIGRVDEMARDTSYADKLSESYQSGALHKIDIEVHDTARSKIIPAREELEAMSRRDLERALRAHRAFMKKAGIELYITEEKDSSVIIDHLIRSDHYLSAALNTMNETKAGQRLIQYMTNPRVSEQLSAEARLDIIANFDQTGVVREVIENLKSAQANKVAPIEKQLLSHMKEVFPRSESDKLHEVTIGGKKEVVSGHTIMSIILASQNTSVRKQMLKNKLQFGDQFDIGGKATKLRAKGFTNKPITEAEITALTGIIKSEDKIIKAWKAYTDSAGTMSEAQVEQIASRKNYMDLPVGYKFPKEDMWFPTVWGSQLSTTVSFGDVISARESWMMAKKADKKNDTLVIPDINELVASHSQSVAKFVGSSSELQAMSDLLRGPSGSGNFFGSEAMSTWDAKSRTRMREALDEGMEQTILPGRKADGFTKSAFFRYMKAGQDLYRLSNPATMVKMASSAHLIASRLMDPKNVTRAFMTRRTGEVSERYFKANAFQYSRGEKMVVADVGDTMSRTKGRSVLQGSGGLLSSVRHLPAMADRLAMRVIFNAVAYDKLPAGMPRTQTSLNAMDGNVEFWRSVTREANRVTMETQPTYESFMRSDLLNRGSFIPVMITRYGTQRNRMMNMIAKDYARMQFTDSDPARKMFEKSMTSVFVTNAILMSSVTAGSYAFQQALKSVIRGEDPEDDESLFGFEKKKHSLAVRTAGTFVGAGMSQYVSLVEGGDEIVKIAQAVYGEAVGKRHYGERALQGTFAAGEASSALNVISATANLGRQKAKMRDAVSSGEYMTAKRSYALSAGKLYAAMSNLIGVGLHLPTRAVDQVLNPKERIRQAVFDQQ